MILWLDAQLPPALAPWIEHEFGVPTFSARHLGLRDANDAAIFRAAREAGAAVITKDADFVALQQHHGAPPQLVWLRCGNTSNARLRLLFVDVMPRVLQLLADGEPLIEITDPA